MSGQKLPDVAGVLDRARSAVAAAQAARDRSEEIRLHELLKRGRGRSAPVGADAEAALRAWLCGAPE